ncbi:MAG: FGGY-family carbohydrate kinase [Candidatus Heimdallarchaeota archaeon]
MLTSQQFIIAHDLGTSTNKAILISEEGEIIDLVKTDFEVLYPKPGYAEQNPMDWLEAVTSTTKQLLDKTGIDQDQVAALTFSSQMQGLLPVDQDGKPLMNCMIWLDARGAEVLHKLWKGPFKIMGYNLLRLRKFLSVTGGSPSLTGKEQIPKIHWLQEFHPEIYENTSKFLDVKDYLIYRLTGVMATSIDLAALWWLMDTRNNRNQWSPSLCKMVNIDINKLPDLKKPTDLMGDGITAETASTTGLKEGTPVVCGAGDMTCAAVGSGMVLDCELHINLGTSGWVAGHVKERKTDIFHYCGCTGSAFPDEYYLVVGHQEIAAGALEWAKNNILYYTDDLSEQEKGDQVYQLFDSLVEQAELGAKRLIFTPWLFGERCPLDDDTVRGGLFNVKLDHDLKHLLRAIYEGVAFNTRWALETVEKLYQKVDCLNIIGGGAQSDIWCQIFADITNHQIRRVKDAQEAGAIGAALLAWKALGKISTVEEIKNCISIDKIFNPNKEHLSLYNARFKAFKDLYKQNKKWYKRINS